MTGAVLWRVARPPDALGLPVKARGQDFLFTEGVGNLLYAHPVQAHAVYPSHHGGGGFLDDPPLGVLRVLLVPIGRLAHRLTGVSFDLVADAPLLGNIAGIPLVKQIPSVEKKDAGR